MINKLKGNVTIRTRSDAGIRLDEDLAAHPELKEAEVTASALKIYYDILDAYRVLFPGYSEEKLRSLIVITNISSLKGTIETPDHEQPVVTPG